MQYFAGLFDAEGCVSLCPNGAFTIAIEMANEEIPKLFQNQFKGSIYSRKRDNKKQTFTWKINSINALSHYFIDSILPYSITKYSQLKRLKDYLDLSREDRRNFRKITCSSIKELKKPAQISKKTIICRSTKPIENDFFIWLAGMIDGDGNIVCNEYIDGRNQQKYFAHQLSIATIYPETICHILDRIQGCITESNKNIHPIFKWVCKRSEEKFVCESILPHLKIKKAQCQLFLEFIKFPKKQKRIDLSIEHRDRMYEIINQIKHLNSL